MAKKTSPRPSSRDASRIASEPRLEKLVPARLQHGRIFREYPLGPSRDVLFVSFCEPEDILAWRWPANTSGHNVITTTTGKTIHNVALKPVTVGMVESVTKRRMDFADEKLQRLIDKGPIG